MFIDTGHFDWQVAGHGYRIGEAYPSFDSEEDEKAKVDLKERFLLSKSPNGSNGEGSVKPKVYQPLKMGIPLHRIFAKVETSESAILEFACRYGPLGHDIMEFVEIPGVRDGIHWGESVKKWTNEINVMKESVAIFEMIMEGDDEGLTRFIQRFSDGSGRLTVKRDEEGKLIFDTRQEMAHLVIGDGLIEGKLFHSAKRALCDIVEYSLQSRCTLGLSLLTRAKSGAMVAEQSIDWGMRERKYGPRTHSEKFDEEEIGVLDVVPCYKPESLIGAIWLDFALALLGNKKFEICAKCHEPFEMKSKAVHQRFCSNACKQAAYRDRKLLATKGDAR